MLSNLLTPHKLIHGKTVGEKISVYPPHERAKARRFKQKTTQTGVTRIKPSIERLSDHPVLVITKGVLRTLVLSGLSPSRSEVFRSATERSEALSAEMVTFLWREKSPAGGITPSGTPSDIDKTTPALVRGQNGPRADTLPGPDSRKTLYHTSSREATTALPGKKDKILSQKGESSP